jgi:hypothetical protein
MVAAHRGTQRCECPFNCCESSRILAMPTPEGAERIYIVADFPRTAKGPPSRASLESPGRRRQRSGP